MVFDGGCSSIVSARIGEKRDRKLLLCAVVAGYEEERAWLTAERVRRFWRRVKEGLLVLPTTDGTASVTMAATLHLKTLAMPAMVLLSKPTPVIELLKKLTFNP